VHLLLILGFATSFPLLCQDENIWFVRQVSWQALAIGGSVYVTKVLMETLRRRSCWIARQGLGGREEEEVQKERWEKSRWSGGRQGLSWRTDAWFCNEGIFALTNTESHTRRSKVWFTVFLVLLRRKDPRLFMLRNRLKSASWCLRVRCSSVCTGESSLVFLPEYVSVSVNVILCVLWNILMQGGAGVSWRDWRTWDTIRHLPNWLHQSLMIMG